MKRAIRRFLTRRGASSAEIESSRRHDYLALLVLDRAVTPGERDLSMTQVAALADTDLDTARAVWRAIGFPDLPDDLPAFTRADADALRAVLQRIESGSVFNWTLDRALIQARVFNASLSRIADSLTDDLAQSMQMARDAGFGDEELAEILVERFDFDGIARLIDHSHRLQLRAAIWRRLAGVDPTAPGTLTGAVGFVDLVGYTALAEDLDSDDLAELVTRFGGVSHDTVVAAGGRVVKTIGDEVMFVTDTALAAARIAVQLAEQSTGDEMLPAVRAGIACGSLLAREGDYFGPVVNLASRLTDLARPASVLASAEVAGGLGADSGISVRRVGTRRIRDIGRVEVFRLRGG